MIEDKLFNHYCSILYRRFPYNIHKGNKIELGYKMDTDLIYSIFYSFKVEFLDKTNN
jgi:hypothetical protein